MTLQACRTVTACCVLVASLASTARVDGQELKVGAAAVRITPPPGGPMAGYYYPRAAEGVHDDLYARAIVLDDGRDRAAMVACDLIGVPAAVVEEARAIASRKTGIPADHIMISATHAHTGPSLIDGSFRTRFEGDTLRIARQYLEDLPGLIAESIEQASRAAVPARVSAGIARETGVAFNRRYYMRDGTVRWNPGKRNPDIVRPAGPIDPDVPIVLFSGGVEGIPKAVYVSHAVHLDTVGGTRYSADFPYTLGRLLAAARHPDLLTLFAMGCAGNVNHVDVSSAEKQTSPEEAARIGTILAADVLRAWPGLTPVATPVLRVGTERVPLDLAEVRPGDVEWATRIGATYGRTDPAPMMDYVRAQRILDVDSRKGRPLDAEVQVIALGDVAWVGLPGEIFTELGMAIKHASPFHLTIVVSLANGSLGYVPDRKAFAEGAYEAISARCAPGSGERLVEAATRQLIRLHRATRAP